MNAHREAGLKEKNHPTYGIEKERKEKGQWMTDGGFTSGGIVGSGVLNPLICVDGPRLYHQTTP